MKIPIIIIKDKQAFSKKDGFLTLLGSPVDVVKGLFQDGYKLVHIIDENALKGFSTNFDVYDKLTFFVNIEVECQPKQDLIKKLISLRSRVVIPPGIIDVSGFEEKLLVAKISSQCEEPVDNFHDLFLVDEISEKKYKNTKKRKISFKKGEWGTIFFF